MEQEKQSNAEEPTDAKSISSEVQSPIAQQKDTNGHQV